MEGRASAVGQRVRYWRQRRNLDRKQFADMVGRSTSWLDKIEKGERSLLRLPMLERVAEVLSIDPSVLTDSEVARSIAQCADVVEVQAIKKALGRYPTLTAHKTDMASVTMRRVDLQLDYAGNAWLSSHFTTVARVLPQLLNDAQLLAAQADAHQKAYRALVMAYRLACSMLLKYDSNGIAWLAADRAMHTAQASGDTIALARATRCVARAMSHTDQLDESVTVATDMADLLRPRLNHAERIDPTLIAGLPTERRSNFLLDLTDAYTQTGNYRMAIQLLAEADHLAPEEVHCRPLARRLITALLSTAPSGTDPRLRHIARRAGVTA